MESHVLNVYHQARYRTIGHKIMRSMSESLSSEGSCNQSSPDYSQQNTNQYEEESNEGEYWDIQNPNVWSQNQKINITKNHDSSIDEEEIDVQEISIDDKNVDLSDQEDEPDVIEEDSLIEGADYDVIQVFAVDPDLDLEGSSEDEEEEDIKYDEVNDVVNTEHLNTGQSLNATEMDHIYINQQGSTSSICDDNLGINLDTPVVSNVDEYFIKENKDILDVKDEPVVKDVDEYFIKDIIKPIPKHTTENNSDHSMSTSVNVDEFFSTAPSGAVVVTNEVIPNDVEDETEVPGTEVEGEVPITESDLEVLPNIEELKRYLLEDIPYSKLKTVQKSCSVPHSPMHNICLDVDSKTCLSFEDLNLDLSDLSFDNSNNKSNNSSKSDDIPRTLTEEDVNSFLITPTNSTTVKEQDDLNLEDMEIEKPVDSIIAGTEPFQEPKSVLIPEHKLIDQFKSPNKPNIVTSISPQNKVIETKVNMASVLKPVISQDTSIITSHNNIPINTSNKTSKSLTKATAATVLDFCIEKNNIKKDTTGKSENDDFVDVESCHETILPVLEANNLNSLLEQFEASEKLSAGQTIKIEPKSKTVMSLTNGMRLQDAGVQLNKNKMRHILMPSTIDTATRRTPSPVHSDHDYCSTKKRHSLPKVKSGRSLLKPEVLSSNHKILSSRHRSCKNKKIVYHQSSDEESEKCSNSKNLLNNDLNVNNSDIKEKNITKKLFKANPICSLPKKDSSQHPLNSNSVNKSNNSVMFKNACKASDIASSQNCNGSIKLTIKNKSEVILRSCDSKEDHKVKIIEKDKKNTIEPFIVNTSESLDIDSGQEMLKPPIKNKEVEIVDYKTKEENSTPEDFYTNLFTDKSDVLIPMNISKISEKRSHDFANDVSPEPCGNIEIEQPQKKKKLNLQEYKLRRGANSNNNSAQVSPEAIFPEMPNNLNLDKDSKCMNQIATIENCKTKMCETSSDSKKIFDPIREASRKILMNSKKQKAEAMRKRDEDIVMSKIPKVENLELQPLISDAEIMKIVEMSGESILPIPIPIVNENVQQPSKDYDEIILVSVATNTDEEIFKATEVKSKPKEERSKISSLPTECKSTINFKIKKSDNVLKHNVFDAVKDDRNHIEDGKRDVKIDAERYKGITATLKSVEKQVETKISSNSLFASIQDVVMKKATTVTHNKANGDIKQKSKSPVPRTDIVYAKPVIVRDYDNKADHGEDKVILHLEKNRKKPESTSVTIQTDLCDEFRPLTIEITQHELPQESKKLNSPRKRKDSSISDESSPKTDEQKHKTDVTREKSQSKEKRSRSKERQVRSRRSRSHSRHRRHRSRSRSRSRSRDRYRRYRRSDSPYRRKRRSRSPYSRRSPSSRRDYRSNRSRSRSRYADKSKSPISKKPSPLKSSHRKLTKSLSPPIRKPTKSESSDTSTSSSSSSGSSSSNSSINSRRASSTYRRNEGQNKKFKKAYSSEDRESNTPVEERRIVFVGRLEQDITKASLRSQFTKFGPVTEVRLHSKEDGSRYGFVTYQRPRDAWSAVEAAASFPQYDVGFGGRRAFCRQSYADLDGLEAKYTESAFHGQGAAPPRRNDDMSFEQMLLDIKKKLNKRKGDKRPDDSA